MSPRYPIYIPSKGRAEQCRTALLLADNDIPFRLVVEPQERDSYTKQFGSARVLVLPWDNPGSVIPARNWIKDHATAEGHERHWQWDDNITKCVRLYRSTRRKCPPRPAIEVVEDLTDRYTNIAISGMNYMTFIVPQRDSSKPHVPFSLNCHVYSCSLMLNETDYRWRGRYNEDTDYCLQALAGGWCTVLVHAVAVDKAPTMTMGGGNTATLYQDDGRLKMARELQRRWPGIVTVSRKWGRPQHVINWTKFRTKLKRRTDIDWDALEAAGSNEYGMTLQRVKPEKQGS